MPPRRRRQNRPGALNDLSPRRIFLQIVLLQIQYYVVTFILIGFTAFVAGQSVNLGLILDWRNVRSDVTTGWMLGLCWSMSALISVIALLLLVARSKLIPDFALTIHFIHFLITSFYTRLIPSTASWWFLQACSASMMIFLGMWACRWRELKPIAFGGNSSITKVLGTKLGSSVAERGGTGGEYELVERNEPV